MNIRTIQATECIFKTNTFNHTFGAWSFIVLEGQIEIVDMSIDGGFQCYHIKLLAGAIVMHYRHNEQGIKSARLYYNSEEPSDDLQIKQNSSLAIFQ